jgi:site-specific recombinase XerD
MKDSVETESSAQLSVNDVHVDAFLAYITVERGLSPNTVEAYGRDLTELRRFLVSQDVSDLRAVGSRHLIGFLTVLRERGLSARSQARILTTLRRFYRFLEREETLPNGSPTAHLLLPKIGRSLPHAPRAPKWRLCWRSRIHHASRRA